LGWIQGLAEELPGASLAGLQYRRRKKVRRAAAPDKDAYRHSFGGVDGRRCPRADCRALHARSPQVGSSLSTARSRAAALTTPVCWIRRDGFPIPPASRRRADPLKGGDLTVPHPAKTRPYDAGDHFRLSDGLRSGPVAGAAHQRVGSSAARCAGNVGHPPRGFERR
jgi:hypothetical protein